MWRGQIIQGSGGTTFLPSLLTRWRRGAGEGSNLPVSLTAEIEEAALYRLATFITHTEDALKAALSQDQERPE